ncbi:hypothetical protein [Pandoraea cepalis]|uniref:hypothetical protein n=1 Tax=Pandoraea cepalis TaxID=2508294 RepID=UPI00263B575C|nr:hypothetical protein [Pandoraea cepalis]
MQRHQPAKQERRALSSLDLRQVWDRTPTPEVRELLWEIHRLHRVLVACRVDTELIRAEWRSEVGGWLVAIESLRSRLLDEPCVAEATIDGMRGTRERGEVEAARVAPTTGGNASGRNV